MCHGTHLAKLEEDPEQVLTMDKWKQLCVSKRTLPVKRTHKECNRLSEQNVTILREKWR